MRSSSFACSLFALLTGAASAFTTCPGVTPGQSPVALQAHRLGDTSCDRVAFLKTSFAAVAAITTFSPAIAVAEDAVDDLAMPSAEEQKVSEDAMAERLRIKAELKKKVSKPMGYKESMAAEKNRQKSLKKTKDETRTAMCEELGRGC